MLIGASAADVPSGDSGRRRRHHVFESDGTDDESGCDTALSACGRWGSTALRTMIVAALLAFMFVAIWRTDYLVSSAADKSTQPKPELTRTEPQFDAESEPRPAEPEAASLLLELTPNDESSENDISTRRDAAPESSPAANGFGSLIHSFWAHQTTRFERDIERSFRPFASFIPADAHSRRARESDSDQQRMCGSAADAGVAFDPSSHTFWSNAASAGGDAAQLVSCPLCSAACSVIANRCDRVCDASTRHPADCSFCQRITLHPHAHADVTVTETASDSAAVRYEWVFNDDHTDANADAANADAGADAAASRLSSDERKRFKALIRLILDAAVRDDDSVPFTGSILHPLDGLVHTLIRDPNSLFDTYPAQPISTASGNSSLPVPRAVREARARSEQLLAAINEWVVTELKSTDRDIIHSVEIDASGGGGGGSGFDLRCDDSDSDSNTADAPGSDVLLSAGGGGGGGVSVWAAAIRPSDDRHRIELKSQLVAGGGGGAGIQIATTQILEHALLAGANATHAAAAGADAPSHTYDWKKWTHPSETGAVPAPTPADSAFDVWYGGGGGAGVVIDRDGSVRTEFGSQSDDDNRPPPAGEKLSHFMSHRFDPAVRSCQRSQRLRLVGGGGRGGGVRLIVTYRDYDKPAAAASPPGERDGGSGALTADGLPIAPLVGRVNRRLMFDINFAFGVAFELDMSLHRTEPRRRRSLAPSARFDRYLKRFGSAANAANGKPNLFDIESIVERQQKSFVAAAAAAQRQAADAYPPNCAYQNAGSGGGCIPVRTQKRKPAAAVQPQVLILTPSASANAKPVAAPSSGIDDGDCVSHPIIESLPHAKSKAHHTTFGDYYSNGLCPLRNVMTADSPMNRFCCQFTTKVRKIVSA